MSDKTWQDLVAEGIAARQSIDNAQWKLGDLALQAEAIGAPHIHSGSEERLHAYAQEVGTEYWALRRYRSVADRWPDGTRVPSVSWSVHRALQGQEDRATLIRSRSTWTVREADLVVAERQLEMAGLDRELDGIDIRDEVSPPTRANRHRRGGRSVATEPVREPSSSGFPSPEHARSRAIEVLCFFLPGRLQDVTEATKRAVEFGSDFTDALGPAKRKVLAGYVAQLSEALLKFERLID
jgi:hypothetical protein